MWSDQPDGDLGHALLHGDPGNRAAVGDATGRQGLGVPSVTQTARHNDSHMMDSGGDADGSSDTGTIDSADSGRCLLSPSDGGDGQGSGCSAQSAPSFDNGVFGDHGSDQVTQPLPQGTGGVNADDMVAGHSTSRMTSDPEQSESATPTDWDSDASENVDTRLLPAAQDPSEGHLGALDTNVESLVQQLAGQHHTQLLAITVEEVSQPAHPAPTTHSQTGGEAPAVNGSLKLPQQTDCLLNSTESLHRYKLAKQSRQTHAVSNGRSKTLDNLHTVDAATQGVPKGVGSSVLNLTAASVHSLGQVCQKALSYLRADMEFGSMMSLKDTVKYSSTLTVGKGGLASDMEALSVDLSQPGLPSVASGRHMRNVLFMSLLITIFFVANYATRNLQSSLNQDGAVGLISLAVMFAFYILGSLLSPVLVKTFGVKRCIVGGLVAQLLFIASNLYPVLWLMVPASAGGGASLALIWNAMSTYIVLLSRGEADYRNKPYDKVADKFFGVFCLIYQSNLIVGNLIAALVLSHGDKTKSTDVGGDGHNASLLYSLVNTSLASEHSAGDSNAIPAAEHGDNYSAVVNSTITLITNTSDDLRKNICGAAFCHHYDLGENSGGLVPQSTVFLLFGIFMLLIVICMVIAVTLLEPLSPALFTVTASPWAQVRRQLISLATFSRNVKFLLLMPLLLYSVMQYSFVSSEITVAFMTCPVGVWLVGYAMMAYGACCSIGSYVCQVAVIRCQNGRVFFIVLAYALNMGLLVLMRVWRPTGDSLLTIFLITSLFGFADGIWNVTANGICGSVFPDHYEEAFTGLRMAQGLGGSFNMAYSPFFCLTFKIYVMMGVVTVVLLGYVAAEILIRREAKSTREMCYEKEVM